MPDVKDGLLVVRDVNDDDAPIHRMFASASFIVG